MDWGYISNDFSTACPRLCQIAAHIPAPNLVRTRFPSPLQCPTEMSTQVEYPTVLIIPEFDNGISEVSII